MQQASKVPAQAWKAVSTVEVEAGMSKRMRKDKKMLKRQRREAAAAAASGIKLEAVPFGDCLCLPGRRSVGSPQKSAGGWSASILPTSHVPIVKRLSPTCAGKLHHIPTCWTLLGLAIEA